MTELILLILAFSLAGVIYGFYDVVQPWLKPKANKIIPAMKRLIPKKKKYVPRFAPTSPQDVIADAHAMGNRFGAVPPPPLASRPWGSVHAETGLYDMRLGQSSQSHSARRAQAAQRQQDQQRAQNDLFWRQIAEECQRMTGSTNFKSYDSDLGKKSK